MNAVLHPRALDHLAYWVGKDPKTVAKILALIADARRNPFTGLGKPEPLRRNFKGWWSRRITDEHRLVYRVTGSGPAQAIAPSRVRARRPRIAQCQFHYG
jgi:toxin YoeB